MKTSVCSATVTRATLWTLGPVQLPLVTSPLSMLSPLQIQVGPKLKIGPVPGGQGMEDMGMACGQSRPLWLSSLSLKSPLSGDFTPCGRNGCEYQLMPGHEVHSPTSELVWPLLSFSSLPGTPADCSSLTAHRSLLLGGKGVAETRHTGTLGCPQAMTHWHPSRHRAQLTASSLQY